MPVILVCVYDVLTKKRRARTCTHVSYNIIDEHANAFELALRKEMASTLLALA